MVAVACGGSLVSATPSAPSTTPSASASLSPPRSPAASGSAVVSPSNTLHLVGLGDSLPGAGDRDRPPTYTCECTSFVTLYGSLAEDALGTQVVVDNLATNDGVGSDGLLDRVRAEDRYRDAIAGADIIAITIGTNDWQGPCNWPDDDDCWASSLASVPDRVGAILDEIIDLRGGRPTAIRLTTYYDQYIGFPTNLTSQGQPDDPMPPAFLAFYRAEEARFYTALCAEATEREVTCVDLWEPFNGPGHDRDAKELLLPDHIHPNQAGHELIADTIAAVGFAPLG
jgi:lysophospholipase L1-like esterase